MEREYEKERIFTGPAGWSYKDWNSIFYPSSRVDRLAFTARYFRCIELNSSFYRIPSGKLVESWAERLAGFPSFLLTVKGLGRFTHERILISDEVRDFIGVFEPLIGSGKLGAFLLQFPWSFKNEKSSREYLTRSAGLFSEYPTAVELRHGSWDTPAVVKLFSDHGISFCNIDQPVIGDSIGPTEYVTDPRAGYIRLHGRNAKNWFRQDAGRDQRYDYLYEPGELSEWRESAARMAGIVERLFIITNNHFRGQALVNAFQFRSMLEGSKVNPPDSLRTAYPVLESISEYGSGQGRLPGLY